MIVQIGRKKYATDNCINLFIAGILLLPIYIDVLDTLSKLIGFSTTLTTYVYYSALWVALLLSIPMIHKRITNKTVMVIFGVAVAMGLHYLFYPKSRDYVIDTDPMGMLLFSPKALAAVVPYMLIGFAVVDIDKLRKVLHTTAKVGIAMGSISYILMLTNGQSVYYDDMNQAYALCVMNCILISDYQKRDWRYLVFGILAVILSGTRGALLGIMVAVLLRMTLLQAKGRKRLTGIVVCSLTILLILFTDLPERILGSLSDIFKLVGVTQLRLFDYAQEDLLLDSSGRDDIQGLLMGKVWENPITGYGLGADRGLTTTESYAHNIAVELWVSFGIIIGTALLAWMAYFMFKAITNKDPSKQIVATALFSSIVIKLMFSSSFLYAKELFILLGICVAAHKKRSNEETH